MKPKLPYWAEDRLEELIERLEEIMTRNSRPSNEIILDDNQVLGILKISKRTLANLKSEIVLKYSKVGAKCYYLLSDVLEMVDQHRVK